MNARRAPATLRAWPVFVALALLALLIAGRVATGIILTRDITSQVDALVEDTQRSLVLAPTDRAALAAEIESDARKRRMHAATIRNLHAGALRREEVTGGVTLALVALVSMILLRMLARQRRLVAERFQLLDEHARDLEAFAGRAAHDLQSPMNPIRGYADLLLESAGSPVEVAVMAGRIRTAVDRMARIVDDMQALSIAGRPSPGIASPEEAVAAAVEDMRSELQGATVATSFRGSKVACSGAILHLILRQLMTSALKFRDRARPLHVTIETRDAGRMVELVVADNGLGMDPETAKHALEPVRLQRMDREVPGHGLGLAIVDRATRSLGGTCELSSALDRGTCVTLRLPRA